MSVCRFANVICYVFFVFLLLVAPPSQGQDSQELVTLPEKITGTVVDDQGKPIVGAEVKLTLYSPTDGANPTFSGEAIPIPVCITNSEGRYELNTSGLEAKQLQFSLWGFITAEGYPAYRMAKVIKGYDGKPIEMSQAIMPAGRKITGRIVAPGGGVQPTNIALRLIGEAGNSKNFLYWNSPTIGCEPDGSFKTYVPKIGKVELSVTAANYAGVQLDVPPKATHFGEIALKKGTSVFGRVLDAKGNPVSGTIVTISGTQSNQVADLANNSMFFPISSSVKTNERGEYRLPPHVGSCRISIANQGTRRSDDDFLAADVPLPRIAPKLIDLAGADSEREVIMQTGDNHIVSGKILWPDGKPVSKVPIKAIVMSGGSGVDVDQTRTNEKGEYRLGIPSGMQYAAVSLSCFGKRVANGAYAYVLPNVKDSKTIPLILHPRKASLQLTKVDHDIQNVDWKMKLQEKRTATVASTRKGKESQMVLSEISSRFHRVGNVGVEPFKAELLALEEKYRGEFAAIIALRQSLSWERDVNSEYPPNLAKQAKLKIIEDHYLTNKDIDVVLDSLVGQVYDPTAVEVLEKLVAESPHDRVKATAAYQLCSHLNEQLNLLQSLQQSNWSINVAGQKLVQLDALDDTERYTDVDRRFFQPIFDAMKDLDQELLREKIGKYIALIDNAFPKVKRTRLIASVGSFEFRRYEPKENETYVELLESQRFDLNHLQVGQTIPELRGNDAFGNPIQLSNVRRGKIVVLYFGRATESLERYQILKEEFAGQPFELMSVFADPQNEVVRKVVEDGQVNWPVIWDGESKAITKSWNMIGGGSDLFLIDSNGVIKKRILDLNSGGDLEKLKRQIKLLIRQAEK